MKARWSYAGLAVFILKIVLATTFRGTLYAVEYISYLGYLVSSEGSGQACNANKIVSCDGKTPQAAVSRSRHGAG